MLEATLRTSFTGKEVTVGLYRGAEVLSVGERRVAVPVYDERALDWLAAEIRERSERGWDTVVLITGDERTGKSCLAAHLAVRLGMREPKICFSAAEALAEIRDAEEGQVVWLDEAGVALYSDEFFKREERDLIKAFQIVGAKRLIFLLCLPHKDMLARKIRERRVNYWIHVYVRGDRRGWARVRVPKKTEFRLDSYWLPLFTFHYSNFASSKLDGIDPAKWWADYEEEKLAHMVARLEEFAGPRESEYRRRMLQAAAEVVAAKGWEAGAKATGYSVKHLKLLLRTAGLSPSVAPARRRASRPCERTPQQDGSQPTQPTPSDRDRMRL